MVGARQGLSRRLSRPDHLQGSAILEDDQNVESGIFKDLRSIENDQDVELGAFSKRKTGYHCFSKMRSGKSLTIANHAQKCIRENKGLLRPLDETSLPRNSRADRATGTID